MTEWQRSSITATTSMQMGGLRWGISPFPQSQSWLWRHTERVNAPSPPGTPATDRVCKAVLASRKEATDLLRRLLPWDSIFAEECDNSIYTSLGENILKYVQDLRIRLSVLYRSILFRVNGKEKRSLLHGSICVPFASNF